MPCVLLCTVGGSHQPILTAIRERQPAFVRFFCTDRDEATGRPGSVAMVAGQGHPIEVRRGETVERLPNIPTQAGLASDSCDVRVVPPDDLDRTVAIMLDAVVELRQRFPDALLVADYTGGTKTMTAALVLAAVESEAVSLQVVTGARADLVKVYDGSQSGLVVSDEGIRIRRAMAPYLAAWQRFAYGEAADGLRRIAIPRGASLRAELQIARDLSSAFDAWDRFDHRTAWDQLELYRPRLGAAAAPWFTALKSLTAKPEDLRRTPARLWDLWLNAQRRAAQCRYDDAVARGYRLLEWTAQWLLGTLGIDTGDLHEEAIPAGLSIPPNADGKRQAGLRNAWELAAHHLGGDVRHFVETESSHMLDQLRKRNYSILAHGDRPIARADWEVFSGWIEAALIPLLRDQAARVGLKTLAPQLPGQPCWRSLGHQPAEVA
jgi:CRISPR-associated protein (TIGR02710 family)